MPYIHAMTNQEIFERLEKRFGTHSEVARYVGITPRHYRNLRSKKYEPKKKRPPIMVLLERIAKASRG